VLNMTAVAWPVRELIRVFGVSVWAAGGRGGGWDGVRAFQDQEAEVE
jgi:hypothetical protein